MAEIEKIKKIAIFSAISAYLILKRRKGGKLGRVEKNNIRNYWRLSRIKDLMQEDIIAGYN